MSEEYTLKTLEEVLEEQEEFAATAEELLRRTVDRTGLDPDEVENPEGENLLEQFPSFFDNLIKVAEEMDKERGL